MIFKILILSAILFNTSMADEFNNDAYDIWLINNDRIPGPVAINNEGPGLFVNVRINDTGIAKDNDYNKWEQEFKEELEYETDKECPSVGSCHIDEERWLSHYPTLNEYINEYFLPEDRGWALRVAFCESSGKPKDQFNEAVNDEYGATGWFQHLPKFWIERSVKAGFSGFAINHPKANVGVASWLFYKGGGSRHWKSSKSCWQTLGD